MALSKIINGGVAASGIPSGGIIQVQRTQFTATNDITVTANTPTPLTDLTVNITPTSSSSIILLQAHIFCEFGTDSNNSYNHTFFFFRDTTKLSQAAASSRNVGISMATRTFYNENDDTTPEIARYDYFDTPASTSQITYKCGLQTRGAEQFVINRTISDGDTLFNERGISFISATEIAG